MPAINYLKYMRVRLGNDNPTFVQLITKLSSEGHLKISSKLPTRLPRGGGL